MTEIEHEREVLTAGDGHEIHVQLWKPSTEAFAEPAGVIQVFHGLGEHTDRYSRFAEAATQRGYVVCAHNHRGHGGHGEELQGYFADGNGWRLLADDGYTVHKLLLERYEQLPLILLGHSMGSFVAQNFAMHYGGRLSGMILSASNWPSRVELFGGQFLACIEALRLGKRGRSTLLDKLGFGDFNKRFQPARTDLDWLTRDEPEVDKYIDDPLCGGPYTCGLWRDLLGGLIELTASDALPRIAGDLPILITGGEQDPVGGEKGMTRLAMRYAETSHQRVSLKIYPDGRHEMLNETNRDQVTADWLDWISERKKIG